MRIGIGYDVHRLEKGYKLIIGGVLIPHEKGLVGHSDADVLIHAIIDALLGAMGLGDIGIHFPDTSAAYKGIDSKVLLGKVVEIMISNSYEIVNLDTIIMAQKPKLLSYKEAMKSVLCQILGIESDQLNIKATTTEKLGFVGREEGIAAEAVVLLTKRQ